MKQWKKAIGIVLAGVVLLTGIALPKNNAKVLSLVSQLPG